MGISHLSLKSRGRLIFPTKSNKPNLNSPYNLPFHSIRQPNKYYSLMHVTCHMYASRAQEHISSQKQENKTLLCATMCMFYCYACFSPHHSQCSNVMSHTPHCVMHKSQIQSPLSTSATTGLTSCQTNWRLNRHSVSGRRTAAGTLLTTHLLLH